MPSVPQIPRATTRSTRSCTHWLRRRPPAEVILEQVRRLKAGLLVMGAYGQPALREFFLGSVTRKVLEESPVPLFLYH